MNFKKLLRQNKGFTLIETLAVLAIVGIMTAVVWPQAAPLSHWKLETAAWNLAGDLRLIRQEAIATGEVCKIVFFISTNSYQVRLAEKDILVYLPEGVFYEGSTTFKGDPPFVHYNVLGHPSFGGTVILKSHRGEKRYVIVLPVTGRVRVSKIPPANW